MDSPVSIYLDTIDGADRAALGTIYSIAREVVPDAHEGTSYGMAALLYRGTGLIAAVQATKFLSLYPFSGAVVAAHLGELAEFVTTSGSIHFSAQHPLPDATVRRLVQSRRAEIDARHSAA